VIITQPKELIGQWVAQKQGRPEPWGNYTAIGLVEHDRLMAGVIYNNFGGAGVCAHISADRITRPFLFAIFDYPFNQLNKRRITALVAKRNRRARRFVQKLGFNFEGNMRHALADDDMLIFGLLKEDCRWHLPDFGKRYGSAA